jgi:hypothetical protein
MTEKKKKQPTPPPRTEVIALPPLKMVLVHAVDEQKSDAAPSGRREQPVDPQALKKLIAHLEQKSQ